MCEVAALGERNIRRSVVEMLSLRSKVDIQKGYQVGSWVWETRVHWRGTGGLNLGVISVMLLQAMAPNEITYRVSTGRKSGEVGRKPHRRLRRKSPERQKGIWARAAIGS